MDEVNVVLSTQWISLVSYLGPGVRDPICIVLWLLFLAWSVIYSGKFNSFHGYLRLDVYHTLNFRTYPVQHWLFLASFELVRVRPSGVAAGGGGGGGAHQSRSGPLIRFMEIRRLFEVGGRGIRIGHLIYNPDVRSHFGNMTWKKISELFLNLEKNALNLLMNEEKTFRKTIILSS